MTHSPASSEDEERHSASECPEGGSESDSSPDGPSRGPRGTRGQGSGAPGSLASTRGLQGRSMSVPDDAHFSMMVFRIGIPDLHQTVSDERPLASGGQGPEPTGGGFCCWASSPLGPISRPPYASPRSPSCPQNHPHPLAKPPQAPPCHLPNQKCLRFNPDATIWTAKQQVLCALSESLQDVLNYGLFQPATSGRDANFLEEERLLREYPQSFEKGVPYLEVRPAACPAWSQRREGLPYFSPSHALARENPVGSSRSPQH